jgi:hypothetical protein
MGMFDSFKRKQENPASPPAPVASPPTGPPAGQQANFTTIDRENFTVVAPFQWKLIPGTNPSEFEFRNQTLPEQLMVTVLLFRESQAPDSLSSTAERLTAARVNAIRGLSNGKAAIEPVHLSQAPNQAEARCIGLDSDNKVRFAWSIRVTPQKAVTVALTRYALKEIGSPFAVYSGTIFDLVKVK